MWLTTEAVERMCLDQQPTSSGPTGQQRTGVGCFFLFFFVLADPRSHTLWVQGGSSERNNTFVPYLLVYCVELGTRMVSSCFYNGGSLVCQFFLSNVGRMRLFIVLPL